MTDLPGQLINTASRDGGILGLFFVLLLGFIVWYIHSSRRYYVDKEKEEAAERSAREQALATERREWREIVDRNTAAFHDLSKMLYSKPCLRPSDARTRDTDKRDRY